MLHYSIPGFWTQTLKAALLVATFGLYGCGAGNGANLPGATGTNGNGGQAGTFLGLWYGPYKVATATPTGGTALTESHQASAEFDSTASDGGMSAGNFNITLTDIPNNTAYVNGTFALLGNSTINLSIATSYVNAIGLPNSTAQLTWMLEGPTTLVLSNPSVTITMSPKTSGTPAGTGTGGTTTPTTPTASPTPQPPATPVSQSTLVGHWNCTDSTSNQWSITLTADSDFAINVAPAGSSGRNLWLDGTFTLANATQAALTVVTAAQSQYIGMTMSLKSTGANAMTVTRMNPGTNTVAASFPCTQ